MTKKYSTPRTQLDVLDYERDNHLTIEKERRKMATTFSSVDAGDKFLPQVVNTAISSSPIARTALAKHKTNTNVLVYSPYEKDISQQIVNDYHEEQLSKDYEETQQRLVSQIPSNGGCVDYKSSWKVGHSLSSHRKHITNCFTPDSKRKFHAGPTLSPDIRGNPNPNYLIGNGYERPEYVQTNNVKEVSERGIFTNTNRKAVLAVQSYSQGLKPPPYEAYKVNQEIPASISELNKLAVPGCIPNSPNLKSPIIKKNSLLNTESGFQLVPDAPNIKTTSQSRASVKLNETNQRLAEKSSKMLESTKKEPVFL